MRAQVAKVANVFSMGLHKFWGTSQGDIDLRKYESITIDPFWVLGVVVHKSGPENMRNWCHTHGSTRVTRIRLEGGIDLESEVSARVLDAGVQIDIR